MSNDEKFPIIFQGDGLKELDEVASYYGISRGETVLKALRLLKLTKQKGGGRVIINELGQDFSIDTKKI